MSDERNCDIDAESAQGFRLCPWCQQPWPCASRCRLEITDPGRVIALHGFACVDPDALRIVQLAHRPGRMRETA